MKVDQSESEVMPDDRLAEPSTERKRFDRLPLFAGTVRTRYVEACRDHALKLTSDQSEGF